MNSEIEPQELLEAVAGLAGAQFVAAAMAEAGRIKALRQLAALEAAVTQSKEGVNGNGDSAPVRMVKASPESG